MPPSQANPYWTFSLWLALQNHRKGEIGDLARFVDKDPTWPAWPKRPILEKYLQDNHPELLANFQEAGTEYEKAIAEGRKYCVLPSYSPDLCPSCLEKVSRDFLDNENTDFLRQVVAVYDRFSASL